MNDDKAAGLGLANMWVGFIAFLAAAVLGVYQVVERSGLAPAIESPELYFASVSTHGVLMGFVLTTFLVMGFGYYTATTSLRQAVWNKPLAWFGFWLSIIGVLLAAVPLLTGQASVLYTFYPPLRAHPAFYIGATLLVVGSWVWCLEMIMMTVTWKRAHPGEAVPLAMFGTTANAVMWLWTSAGVAAEMLFQLIPWSLGVIATPVDWFLEPVAAAIAVCTTTIWKGYPFFTIMLLAAMQAISKDLYDAAKVDGANSWQRFRYVTLPALRGVTGVALLVNSLWAFREFTVIYVLTGGGPVGATETLSVWTYKEAFESFEMGFAASIGVITLIISVIGSIFFVRWSAADFY